MTNYSLIKAAYDMFKYKTEEKENEYKDEIEKLKDGNFKPLLKNDKE